MLRALHLKNFLLFDNEKIEIGPGFMPILGESGSGKSLLLLAIDIVFGLRADKSWVREGQEVAEIEAAFQIPLSSPFMGRY